MKNKFATPLWVILGLVSLPGVVQGITVPLSDPTYIPFDDLQTFNWQILNQEIGTPVPALSTASSTPYVRMYSNGNPNPIFNMTDPVHWATPGSGPDQGKFNPTQTSALWWGLNFNQQSGQVTRVLTGGDVLNAIQTLNPGSVTPVFAFDQNQVGNETKPLGELPAGWASPVFGRDIWLRGRVILLNPAAIPVNPGNPGATGLDRLLGLTSTQVDGVIAGMTLPSPNTPLPPVGDPANFDPGVNANALIFYFRDTLFQDFPDPLVLGSDGQTYSRDWLYLPGIYQVTVGSNTYTADNNGQGSNGDWGGYFPNMNLTNFQNWGFLFELQGVFDDDGQEELYMIGGVTPRPPPPPPPAATPEPLSAASVALALAGLGLYVRRRRA